MDLNLMCLTRATLGIQERTKFSWNTNCHTFWENPLGKRKSVGNFGNDKDIMILAADKGYATKLINISDKSHPQNLPVPIVLPSIGNHPVIPHLMFFVRWTNKVVIYTSRPKKDFWDMTYGDDTLAAFFKYLNNIYPPIHFTMWKTNNELQFLKVLMNRRENATPCYSVFQNWLTSTATFTKIIHNPAQQQRILQTLAYRVTSIRGTDHSSEELKHLKEAFETYGYSSAEMTHTLHHRTSIMNINQETKQSSVNTLLPYLMNITDSIGSFLIRQHIKISFKPMQYFNKNI